MEQSPEDEQRLRRLERFLAESGASARRLAPAAFEAARRRWRRAFEPKAGARSWSWGTEGYDWHVFSLERHEALEGEVATLALRSSTRPGPYLVLAADAATHLGLAVDAGPIVDLAELREDWTLGPADWRWSMTWTHREIGPYFAQP